jgi:preprotein translocase subunit SecF
MRLFNTVPKLDFLRFRRGMGIWSVVLVSLCIVSFFVRGLSFGIDFTGGTLIEVSYTEPMDPGVVRETLGKAGFGDVGVQRFGTTHEVLIRIPPRGKESSSVLSNQVFSALNKAVGGKAELRRVEYVGPQVGSELVEQAGLAVLYSLIGILIYVAMRFEYRFALGAIIATVHDTVITVGWFSLFGVEFDLTVLAAVLAVIGYSLNDTIVVFDRIRENFRRVRKGTVLEIANLSLNETLSRTTITSLVTLLAVIALYVFGGDILRGFSLALIVGIVVGTYSSIYVASASAIAFGVSRADLVVAKKETQLDGMP